MRAAIVQMQIVDGDPAVNLCRAAELINANPGADLYVIPELWTTGYAHGCWSDAARNSTPDICGDLQALAEANQAWIAGSMISQNAEGHLVNRLWAFPPDGEPPVHYDKGHLFRPMQEHLHLAAGKHRVRRRIAGVETALSICFDLRFPEMYRRDAVDGAEMFLVVSEWPHPRSETLRTLARARAMENQAYLALSNRVGRGADGTDFCGGSMVVAPDGAVLAEAGEVEAVVFAEIDAAKVREARSAFPVLGLRAEGLDF
ncbi:MAG: carbon-nitrogen family hydrolase [Holophagaceae bacterium]|nr:carbon-nitrogen family hydrolase [Holophagaceae bacterium]